MYLTRSLRPFKQPIRLIKLTRPIKPLKAYDLNTLNTTSYLVGKSIILFTMFYCTLNWAHYRDLRKKED